MKPELKKGWQPTQAAFRSFLGWLDEGSDSGGEKYLEVRRRLASYFDRRNCFPADELADETLNRVARRLEEEGTVSETPPVRYCYIVARFVFLEHIRQTGHRQVEFDEQSGNGTPPEAASSDSDPGTQQRLLESLDQCLQQLSNQDRELILDYYRGEQRARIERRREIAARLHLTANAVTIRACRIRERLESCLKRQAAEA